MIKKVFAIVLALCSLTFAISGCNKNKPQENEHTNSNDFEYDEFENVDKDKVVGEFVKNGTTNYTIRLSDHFTESELYAANELKDLVKKSSGAELTIIMEPTDDNRKFVSIGNTKAKKDLNIETANLKNDGFIIKTNDSNLYICGSSQRATIYGVNDFVEKYFGIRFLTPSETYIPKVKDCVLYETDIKEEGSFEYRNNFTYGVATDDVFYTRMRMNAPERVLPEKFGGKTDWYNKFDVIHNSFKWVSPDKYYKEHPEMFSSLNGFTLEEGGQKPAQLCMTNGITDDGQVDTSLEISTFKAALETFKQLIKETEGTNDNFFFFGQNDYYTARCQCDRCKKAVEENGGYAGVNIRFLNCLLREARKWMEEKGIDRHIKLGTFAYQYTQNAPVKKVNGKYVPVNSTVVPDKDLYIRIACYHDEYYSWFDEKQDESVRNKFETWGSLTNNLMIWSYETNFYQYFWYFPTVNRSAENLRNFKKNEVVYAMLQDNYNEGASWQTDLNTYVNSKLLWNPYRSTVDLINEYIELYYGIVSDDIKHFIDEFNAHYAMLSEGDTEWYMFMLTTNELYDSINYPIDFLENMLEIVNNAIEKVENSNLSNKEKDNLIIKLRKVRLTPICMIAKNYNVYYDHGREDFCNYYIDECKALGVTRASEAITLEEYRKLYNY